MSTSSLNPSGNGKDSAAASFDVASLPSGMPVISVTGELDLACADDLVARLTRAGQDGGPAIVDLRECTFIDSTGIAALLKAAESRNGTVGQALAIAGAAGQVERVFKLTGVDAVVPVFASVEAAVEALNGRA